MPKENIESGRRIQVRNKDIFNPKDNRENKQNDKFGDMAVFTLTGKQDIYIDGYPVLEDMERNGRFVEAEDHDAAYAKRVAGNRIR